MNNIEYVLKQRMSQLKCAILYLREERSRRHPSGLLLANREDTRAICAALADFGRMNPYPVIMREPRLRELALCLFIPLCIKLYQSLNALSAQQTLYANIVSWVVCAGFACACLKYCIRGVDHAIDFSEICGITAAHNDLEDRLQRVADLKDMYIRTQKEMEDEAREKAKRKVRFAV